MIDLSISSMVVQIGAITLLLLLFTYAVFKYLTYSTPNPDAKIKLSDRDPNHKLKGYKRQDLSIHELRNYDGRHPETNNVIFVAVNGFIFDVTVDRHLYGPGGHYFAFAGRDASRALSKFTVSCESIPTEDDLMPDLSSSEVAQLNEWYGQFSERYQCVGRLIRSNQERYVYDHSSEELLDDSDENFDDDIDRYCGIQSEVMTVPSMPKKKNSVDAITEGDSTVATDQLDYSSDQYNKPLLNELNRRKSHSKNPPCLTPPIPNIMEDDSSNDSHTSDLCENNDYSPRIEFNEKRRSSSSHSFRGGNDLITQ